MSDEAPPSPPSPAWVNDVAFAYTIKQKRVVISAIIALIGAGASGGILLERTLSSIRANAGIGADYGQHIEEFHSLERQVSSLSLEVGSLQVRQNNVERQLDMVQEQIDSLFVEIRAIAGITSTLRCIQEATWAGESPQVRCTFPEIR